MTGSQLDVVIPVFNEIEIIEQLHTRVVAACRNTGLDFRIIYVDDGSHDGTSQWLSNNVQLAPQLSENVAKNLDSGEQCLKDQDLDPKTSASARSAQLSVVSSGPPLKQNSDSGYANGQVSLVELSRNFGQPSAILAGLESSQGDCVVIMDGDLQDPPELIPELVSKWRSGNQVVIAERTSRKESFFRGLAFKTFHKCFRYLADSKIPPNTGTFCLLDRVAADSICSLPESHRFFPGLRAWVGYDQAMVQFARPPRAGGEPKQTFVRLLKYALDAVFGYSFKPLRLLTGVGVSICMISFMLAAWFMMKRMMGWETASIGFTTLTCAVFGLGGFQLIGMGVLGEYIGRIYDEVKARPQYIVGTQTEIQLNTNRSSEPNKRLPSRTSGRVAG